MGCSPWGREESDTTESLHFHFYALEKEMATHSSVFAWRIPGMAEPGGLPSMGSQESDTTAITAATAAGLVRTTVYGSFQCGAKESCFQPLTTPDPRTQIHESVPQGGTASFLVQT